MFGKQVVEQGPNVKIMLPVGATMDLPTGTYVKGTRGQMVLLAGLGYITGLVGGGNMFKSTIGDYMLFSAAARMSHTGLINGDKYDCDMCAHEHRLNAIAQSFDEFKDKDLFRTGQWTLTDKSIYPGGEEWYEKKKEQLKEKKDNAKSISFDTPFLSRDGVTPLKMMVPTFSFIDSLSEFEDSSVMKIQDENNIGESGGNMVHMRAGLGKYRLLMEIPSRAVAHNHFFMLAGQYGKENQMQSSPYAAPPPKKLQHMKVGDKVKGVTDKFFTATNNCWHACSASLLVNQKTKEAEYPLSDDLNGEVDLNLVTLKQLRSKSGPTGVELTIIVSQKEGVLPSLTEFHFIKDHERFGINGTLQNYELDMLPGVRLSRTVVRNKIDSDPKLRRALNITSELLQFMQYQREHKSLFLSAADLYKKIEDQGYDWDFILTRTRGWWTIDSDKHPLYELSTFDIIKMAHGLYIPYWMEEDKKTIKPAFVKA